MKTFRTAVDAFRDTGDLAAGLAAAVAAVELGNESDARDIADQLVRELTQRPLAQLDASRSALLGAAYLLRGDRDDARRCYCHAVALAPLAAADIAAMRNDARGYLAVLGQRNTDFDDLFPMPAVCAFSGHMIDAPGRAEKRFPPEQEDAVRCVLRALLRKHHIGLVCSSAARGSDLILLEELLALGGSAHVFLPFPREDFVVSSVGPDWATRFHRILADPRVHVETLACAVPSPDKLADAYEHCNHAFMAQAAQTAEQWGEAPLMLAVWNGAPGDGKAGTADALAHWRAAGRDAVVISPWCESEPC